MQDGQQQWGNSMPNQASTEDEFLKALIDDKMLVSVFMINGIRLNGHVASFDRRIVMLESLAGFQMVFRHAISTVMPGAADRPPRPPHAAGNRARTSRT
ncbi:RNA chaperone Hfq [Paraburkholderia sp. RL17-337-BIB-A]|uniref:RNA chaperone Hfq n=1 Tax=Paraburkholderia sp. RL17-337-BIB-A TaxID=3031636 RepID=UPI0038BBDDE8